MYSRPLIACAIAAALSHTAVAEDSTALDPVLITADRFAQSDSRIAAATTVISREDILNSHADGIADLLLARNGIDVSRTGGAGQQTSIFMRGGNSNHVLVLIDGVRVASAHTGGLAWEHLPLTAIERIEIVRGPRAAIWGSDAIGGVIQIFTRHEAGGTLRLEAGRWDDYSASTYASNGDWYAGANWREVGGFSAQNVNGFGFNPDDDGYRNASVQLGGDWQMSDRTRLNISGLGYDARTEFDQGLSDIRLLNGAARLHHRRERQDHELVLGHNEQDLTTPSFGTDYDSARTTLDYRYGLRGSDYRLDAGLNYAHSSGVSASVFGANRSVTYDRDRDNTGLFLRGERELSKGTLVSATARADHDSQFGTETTGALAIQHTLSQQLSVYGHVGTAFRAPNLNELYSPGFGGQYAGNPELDPETSRSLEAGLRYSPDSTQQLTLDAYRSHIDGLIAFNGPAFSAINIDEAEIDGAELGYQARFERVDLEAGWTWQQARNGDDGSALVRRAKHKGRFAANYRVNQASYGATTRYVGERPGVGGVTLDAFWLLDVNASWELSDSLSLSAALKNAFDEDYSLAYGYNTPGRHVRVAVDWRFF